MKKTFQLVVKVLLEPQTLWQEPMETPDSLWHALYPLAITCAAIPAIAKLIGRSILGLNLGPFGHWHQPIGSALLSSILLYVMLVGGVIGFAAILMFLAKFFNSETSYSLEHWVVTASIVTIPVFLGGLFLLYNTMTPLWFLSGLYGIYILRHLAINSYGMQAMSSWQFSIISFALYYILILGFSFALFGIVADAFTPSIAEILKTGGITK